jgi:hypothetical protein
VSPPLRSDIRLADYAAEAYLEQLQRVAGTLRQAAADVVRRGTPTTHLATLAPDHVASAKHVITTVGNALANLGLDRLVDLAHQADPPADTPAVLLDRAATALAAAMFDNPDDADDARAVELAEAALRGAGVLR